MKEKRQKKTRYTNIGGQALLEGVMMRGQTSMALAVRHTDGSIMLETERMKQKKSIWLKIPVIRGAVNFIFTMILGVKTMLKSADAGGDESEKLGTFWAVVSVLLGVGLFVGLFILAPSAISDILLKFVFKTDHTLIRSLTESLLRIIFFIAYLLLMTLMKDIKRTFMYHGAEHKTINCYEYAKDMTVQNVQSCSTKHDRCGTSFLFFVMVVSIIVFSLANWLFDIWSLPNNIWIRMGIRILFLPVVAGLSYELLKGLARVKSENLFVRILKAPGMGLQKLTTKQPDDDMVEVALTAFNAVLLMDQNESIPAITFGQRIYPQLRQETQDILHNAGITETAETDWLLCEALNVKREDLARQMIIPQAAYSRAIDLSKQRAAGKPLARALQKADFYGRTFLLNDQTLIPRMETELVCEQAIQLLGDGTDKTVLDLCAGSGVLGITIARETHAKVIACDISAVALAAAEKNAGELDVTFYVGNMFDALQGQDYVFDMIVCNPPYIKSADLSGLDEEVRSHDPVQALDGGADGLDFYRVIAQQATHYLKENGILVLETGFDTAQGAAELLKASFKNIQIRKDYSGNDRIVTAYKG